ncbi:MAG: DUF4058 family protein [Chloroflexaceae bacterium]|nr:DUF4058 family protein [Chloroflexaceae bacterium]
MPSPFPGMDPYLEGEMWQEFHSRLANQISMQLMPLIAPKYVALLSKRYVLDLSTTAGPNANGGPRGRVIYPDVGVSEARARETTETTPWERGGAGVATAAPAVELVSLLPDEVPQVRVEIRDVARRQLVTVIELLSPANKSGEGMQDYLSKRVEVLKTSTHLLELDLLRGGTRIALVGEPPPAPYYVYLSRGEHRPYTQVWPVALRHPLPTVPVPLLPPDPDVPLDVQAAISACFALVGYERLLDYALPPPPPEMGAEDRAWVAERVRAYRASDA